MSKTNKIKALLALKGLRNVDFCQSLQLSRPQALNTKYMRDAFTGDDLLVLAKLTGTRLAFIDPITKEALVSFEESDFKSRKKRCDVEDAALEA